MDYKELLNQIWVLKKQNGKYNQMNQLYPQKQFNKTENLGNPKTSEMGNQLNKQRSNGENIQRKNNIIKFNREYGMEGAEGTRKAQEEQREPNGNDWRLDQRKPAILRKQAKSVDVFLKTTQNTGKLTNSTIITKEYKHQLRQMTKETSNLNDLIKQLKQGYIERSSQRLKELKDMAKWYNPNKLHLRKRIPTPYTDYYMEIREHNLNSKGLKSAFDDFDDRQLIEKYTPVAIPVGHGPGDRVNEQKQGIVQRENPSWNQRLTLASLSEVPKKSMNPEIHEPFSFSRNFTDFAGKKVSRASSIKNSRISIETSKKPFYKIPEYFNQNKTRNMSESAHRNSPFCLRRTGYKDSIKNRLVQTLLYSERDPHSTYFGEESIHSYLPKND